MIRNNKAVDLSEQHIVSCSKAGTCAGGWWAFDFAVKTGVASEDDFPYDAADDSCLVGIATPYHASGWSYVGTSSSVPPPEKLKDALCKHGPLVVAVNATPLFVAYTGGTFDEQNKGTAAEPVNHAVTLIGWSDKKGAWLIKNSWGVGWGEPAGIGTHRGYMWIKYGSNNVGLGAAWVEVQIERPAGGPKAGR